MGLLFIQKKLMAMLSVVTLTATVCGQDMVRSVPELRGLSAEAAGEGIPVDLLAQVVRLGPGGNHFFVFTEQGGVYVQRLGEVDSLLPLSAGDQVHIFGKTYQGEFYPAIIADRVERIGAGKLPQGRPFLLNEIYRPASDCDWVSVEGRLVGSTDQAEISGRFALMVEIDDSIQLVVHLPARKPIWSRLPELMFRRVRFNAVVGTMYNRQRQQTGRSFMVDSINDFQLLEDDGLGSVRQSLPIESLMRVDVDPSKAVRTEGLVTHASESEIFLRGSESSLKVAVLNNAGLEAGQMVEVEGFVWPQSISPAFRALVVRVNKEAGKKPEPLDLDLTTLFGPVQPEDLLDSRMNYELVRVQAHLVEVGKSFGLSSDAGNDTGHDSLLCRSDGHLFEVRLPPGMVMHEDLKPGALLELTGICHLMYDETMQWRLYFDGLWLQVRDAADIAVLQAAPWWTPQRLLWLLGIVLVCLVAFLSWIIALQKTVDRQTGIIGDKIEREAVLDERQRIARELHDNLEQGLAGTAIQLQGARRLLSHNIKTFSSELRNMAETPAVQPFEEVLDRIDMEMNRNVEEFCTAQEMLAYCGDESRTSIIDLRGGLLEKMDLLSALKEALTPLAEECGAVLEITVVGESVRLKQMAERNLLMVAREAVTNAVRHGNPSSISVALNYQDTLLSMVIVNDGKGFDPKQLPPAGHFGLRGMHERINRINGEIEIESDLTKGTTVSVVLNSLKEWELEQV
ncbi:sensor histidine kinase [Pontiellaceae bacterium B12227]|nr:sensor histidine kinase [Pontiellaceae bacterium B12227]